MDAIASFFIAAVPSVYLGSIAQASHKIDSMGIAARGLPRHREDGTASRYGHHGL